MNVKSDFTDKITAKSQRQQVCHNNCTATSGVDEKGGTARRQKTAPCNGVDEKRRHVVAQINAPVCGDGEAALAASAGAGAGNLFFLSPKQAFFAQKGALKAPCKHFHNMKK